MDVIAVCNTDVAITAVNVLLQNRRRRRNSTKSETDGKLLLLQRAAAITKELGREREH